MSEKIKKFLFFKYYDFGKNMGSLKIATIPLYSFYRTDGFFWFRIFNHGLVFKDTTKYHKLFSERYNHCFYIMIGKWLIKSVNS